jgi:hypothetical protein
VVQKGTTSHIRQNSKDISNLVQEQAVITNLTSRQIKGNYQTQPNSIKINKAGNTDINGLLPVTEVSEINGPKVSTARVPETLKNSYSKPNLLTSDRNKGFKGTEVKKSNDENVDGGHSNTLQMETLLTYEGDKEEEIKLSLNPHDNHGLANNELSKIEAVDDSNLSKSDFILQDKDIKELPGRESTEMQPEPMGTQLVS